MKIASYIAITSALLFVSACTSPSVDMPDGTREGYSSARFIRPDNSDTSFAVGDTDINEAIQTAMAAEIESNGLELLPADAELAIAHLLIVQDNVTTKSMSKHFGYGRDMGKISNVAHARGVVNRDPFEAYEVGTLVVDVIDTKTGVLVYRNYVKREIIPGLPEDVRQKRIDIAIKEVLAPFFKK